jgi:6-phosphofructokinase 2
LTQIVTLTANPAIDLSTSVSKLAPFSKLRCAPPQRDPGGGGINVARVIKRLGGDVIAIYPSGGSTGQLLRGLMDREGMRSITTPTLEETREDFTVFEEATTQQYRFVLPGARLSEKEWQKCLDQLASLDPRPDFVVASGSLPPGVPEDFFGRIARGARASGAKVVVDTSGPPLKAALLEGVYLIKPNLREFHELTGTRSSDDRTLIEAGRILIARGSVKLIALTLGSEGALLIGEHDALRANGLPIKPASVVGAGDSFLAAMVLSLAKQDSLEIALKWGVAAGSAALLNPGTELCRSEDVQRLVPQVSLRPGADSGVGS